MFELFGEFDSVEEMNKAAEGFKNEGDIESLKKMAEENGIDEAFADMYASRAMPGKKLRMGRILKYRDNKMV